MSNIIQTSIFDALIHRFVFINEDGTFEMRLPEKTELILDTELATKYIDDGEVNWERGWGYHQLIGRFKDQNLTLYLIQKFAEFRASNPRVTYLHNGWTKISG